MDPTSPASEIVSGMMAVLSSLAVLIPLALILINSIQRIGPTEVGLVIRRFSSKKLTGDNPIAFQGEAGYQADLLTPGWRFKLWPIFSVEKHPWVQVPANEIGVVIAQVGQSLPTGAKSGRYKKEFGTFSDLCAFIQHGGEKGVQRPVLSPGATLPIHPVGFLVITKNRVYGLPVSTEFESTARSRKGLTHDSFGLSAEQLNVVRIEPRHISDTEVVDHVGIVTVYEGAPLDGGDIASRIGGFQDIRDLEQGEANDLQLIETVLRSKNDVHNNYQDFQAFLDAGGRIGLQHDPLLYGAYTLNPFLVSVEEVPMLVVNQGEVAVIKAYVGLPTEDQSGTDFKFGSLVRPGHSGIWQEPLRTGKYPINPRCYKPEIVPTAILTLNWAEATSKAHNLDHELTAIDAKSMEGFVFSIDLQVQIHVPDTKAPRVISMVGTMLNLVNEILQAAVGNHFRDTLQSMSAVEFIQKRQGVQIKAFDHITLKLGDYHVETRGVYIQDVTLPKELVEVLTEREIANQRIETYKMQKSAEDQRVAMEHARGTADAQLELAQSAVLVAIEMNKANAKKAEADGQATYIRETGAARSAEVEAVGLARATAYRAQVAALGREATTLVNIAGAISDGRIKVVPEMLVMSSNGNGSADGVLATLMRYLRTSTPNRLPVEGPETEELIEVGETATVAVEGETSTPAASPHDETEPSV